MFRFILFYALSVISWNYLFKKIYLFLWCLFFGHPTLQANFMIGKFYVEKHLLPFADAFYFKRLNKPVKNHPDLIKAEGFIEFSCHTCDASWLETCDDLIY